MLFRTPASSGLPVLQDLGKAENGHALPVSTATGEQLPALTTLSRALLLLCAEGFSAGLGVAFLTFQGALPAYMTANTLSPAARNVLLLDGVGGAAVLSLASLLVAVLRRRRAPILRTCLHVGRRLAPVAVVGFLPPLFEWRAWAQMESAFLALALVCSLCLEAGLRTSLDAGPVFDLRVPDRARRWARRFAGSRGRLGWLPVAVVCVASALFGVLASILAIELGAAGRRGPEGTGERAFLQTLLNGGTLVFPGSAPPLVGRHASPFAGVLALLHVPFRGTWLLPSVQSALLGSAAIPLYLLARLRLGKAPSVLIALAYLAYTPLLGAALDGFHYLTLSGGFVLWSLYGMETRRHVLALAGAVLALSVHEEAALLLATGFAFLLVTGRRPIVASAVIVFALSYFAVMRGLVLPRLDVGSAALPPLPGRSLLPPGQSGFGAVVATILGNPWFVVGRIDEIPKLAYLLQLFVPLALAPLRRGAALVLLAPGVLFTLMERAYAPAVSVHSHLTTYWTPLVLVGTIHVLSVMDVRSRRALLGAIALASLVCAARNDVIFFAILGRVR